MNDEGYRFNDSLFKRTDYDCAGVSKTNAFANRNPFPVIKGLEEF